MGQTWHRHSVQTCTRKEARSDRCSQREKQVQDRGQLRYVVATTNDTEEVEWHRLADIGLGRNEESSGKRRPLAWSSRARGDRSSTACGGEIRYVRCMMVWGGGRRSRTHEQLVRRCPAAQENSGDISFGPWRSER
jgi:hypothetical protein